MMMPSLLACLLLDYFYCNPHHSIKCKLNFSRPFQLDMSLYKHFGAVLCKHCEIDRRDFKSCHWIYV